MVRIKDSNKITQIFEATLKLILATGFADLKISDIAKEAKIGTGTFYLYFEGKEGLINSLFSQLKQEKQQILLKDYLPTEPFYTTFKKVWYNYHRYCTQNFPKMLFMEQYRYSVYLSAHTKQEAEQLQQELISLIQQAQQAELIKPIAPVLIINSITGTINELSKYYHALQQQPSPAETEQCFQMAWNAIRV